MTFNYSGPFKKYINDYIIYKRQLGNKVSASYQYVLLTFDKYMMDRNIDIITLKSIYEFINSQNISNNTKARIATILRGFTKYLYQNGIIDFILPEKIYTTKRTFKPYIFNNDEINKFFSTIKSFYPNCEFKNDILVLCFLLLYCTGMRIGECLSIKFSDIDFTKRTITLYDTKNKEDRNIVINDFLIDKIKYIKNKYKNNYLNDNFIFIKPDGSRHDSRSIYSVFKKVIYYSKITKDSKSPRVHDFRFTFCCKCYEKLLKLENGKSFIPVLSAYVGHKDFKSTEYYLTLVSELYPEIRQKAENYTKNIIRNMEDFDE